MTLLRSCLGPCADANMAQMDGLFMTGLYTASGGQVHLQMCVLCICNDV